MLGAALAHNAEEGLTYGDHRSAALILVRRAWPAADLPSPETFQTALVVLSAGLAIGLVWASGSRASRASWNLIRVVAAVFLANVMIPHVPAALLLGGYVPGLSTAILVNLPFCAWIVWQRCDLDAVTSPSPPLR